MLQVIGTAAAALVGAHRYSNSNSPRTVGAVELNAYLGVGTSEDTAKKK